MNLHMHSTNIKHPPLEKDHIKSSSLILAATGAAPFALQTFSRMDPFQSSYASSAGYEALTPASPSPWLYNHRGSDDNRYNDNDDETRQRHQRRRRRDNDMETDLRDEGERQVTPIGAEGQKISSTDGIFLISLLLFILAFVIVSTRSSTDSVHTAASVKDDAQNH